MVIFAQSFAYSQWHSCAVLVLRALCRNAVGILSGLAWIRKFSGQCDYRQTINAITYEKEIHPCAHGDDGVACRKSPV